MTTQDKTTELTAAALKRIASINDSIEMTEQMLNAPDCGLSPNGVAFFRQSVDGMREEIRRLEAGGIVPTDLLEVRNAVGDLIEKQFEGTNMDMNFTLAPSMPPGAEEASVLYDLPDGRSICARIVIADSETTIAMHFGSQFPLPASAIEGPAAAEGSTHAG